MRNSLGCVDDETGTRVDAGGRGARRRRQRSSRRCAPTTIAAFALPLGHSSVWFRDAAGFSPNDRAEPFANFFFGGFGNNYVDHRDEKRYREYYGFPGAELNEIGGRNFVKSTVEWNLPPWRFRRVGTPGFYATWLRPAMFVTGLATNLDDAVDGSPRGGRRRRAARLPVHDALGARPDAVGRAARSPSRTASRRGARR